MRLARIETALYSGVETFKQLSTGIKREVIFRAIQLGHNLIPTNPNMTRRFAIARTYRDFLGRNPDWGGLKMYTGQLASGRDLLEIRAEIGRSGEANERLQKEAARKSEERIVEALYKATLHRPIDLVGVKDYIRSKKPVYEVRDSLIDSEEHRLVSQEMLSSLGLGS